MAVSKQRTSDPFLSKEHNSKQQLHSPVLPSSITPQDTPWLLQPPQSPSNYAIYCLTKMGSATLGTIFWPARSWAWAWAWAWVIHVSQPPRGGRPPLNGFALLCPQDVGEINDNTLPWHWTICLALKFPRNISWAVFLSRSKQILDEHGECLNFQVSWRITSLSSITEALLNNSYGIAQIIGRRKYIF